MFISGNWRLAFGDWLYGVARKYVECIVESMKDFRTLHVWQKAHQLVLDLYQTSKAFPEDERFGLTNQLRRAAVSIPSNIAEGCGRSGDAELRRFMQIAMGSASEVDYQLQLARDLGYCDHSKFENLNQTVIETRKMLNAFLKKL